MLLRARTLYDKLSRRQRIGVGAAFAVAIFSIPGCLELVSSPERVARRVRVGDVSVSRLERSALEETLGKIARELEKRPLGARIAGKRFTLEPRKVGFGVDVRATAERVLGVGHRGGLFARLGGAYARLFSPARVEIAARLDRGELSKLLHEWEKTALPDAPFGGGIKVEGVTVTALPPHAGRRIDVAAAERALGAGLVADERRDVEIEVVKVPAPAPLDAAESAARGARALLVAPITLRSTNPEASVVLSPEKLGAALTTEPGPRALTLAFLGERLQGAVADAKKAIETEPVDARIEIDEKESVHVVPSRDGLRIDGARLGPALMTAAERSDRTGELPLLHEPKPALTTEQAEHLGIKGLVSSFTTRHPCCEKRVENIHRIADIMNGRIVQPGETVSVNALVGPRTLKNGFVPAPTIEEGEIVDSIGGGISQFATTFFNALFHGGYEIIERQPHTYWFPRYPMGHEATLSWPKPDIIFKNDTAAGMVFKTSYTKTSITVKIYGDNGGRKVRAEVSGRQNVIEAPVEILPNAHVAPDEEKIKEPGSVGWSVIVSRFLTFPDGTKREDRRRVTYKPRPKRVEVHPCRIPKGEKGYTGERCPEPEDVEEIPEAP